MRELGEHMSKQFDDNRWYAPPVVSDLGAVGELTLSQTVHELGRYAQLGAGFALSTIITTTTQGQAGGGGGGGGGGQTVVTGGGLPTGGGGPGASHVVQGASAHTSDQLQTASSTK